MPRTHGDSSRFRRIVAGVGSNSLSQGVTVAIQLLGVPAYLSRWSLEDYGVWVMLSTIPTYLVLSDLGFTSAAASRMAVLLGRGALGGARRVLKSLRRLLSIAAAIVLAVALAVSIVLAVLNGDLSVALAVFFLALTVVLAQVNGFAEASLRATSQYATATALGTLGRALEFVGGLVGLFASGSFAAVAACMVVGRIVATAVSILAASNHASQLPVMRRIKGPTTVKLLLGESLSVFAVGAASAMALQSVTLVVGGFLGPAAAAVFGVHRTISRAVVQTASVFSHAVWIEFSTARGLGDAAAMRRIYRGTSRVNTVAAVAGGVTVAMATPIIVPWWTQGDVASSTALALPFGVYALTAASWHHRRVLLMAVGRSRELAVWVLATASVVVGGTALVLASGSGLVAVVWIMACGEAVTAGATWRLARLELARPDKKRREET